MVEAVSIAVALVVFAFIVFSTYSSRNEKFTQRKKAYELKEAHMKKSMDMVRTEITLLEREIFSTQARFEDLDDLPG